jgi:hypothetical protein
MLLVYIVIGEMTTASTPVVETNARMRTRMCREHVDTSVANPRDSIARQAVEECVVAGYLDRSDTRIVID